MKTYLVTGGAGFIKTRENYIFVKADICDSKETPLNAHSPYSASKAAADMIVKAYYDTYSLPVNITRCSNNYGAYQFPEKLIPLMINNCLHKKSLPVYGNGKNIRDWLYVADHCQADDAISKDLITYVEDRKGHDWRYAIDSGLLKKELSWQPNIKFKDGIELTINWYLDNLDWMKEITSGEYKNYYQKFYGNRKLIKGE